MQFSRLRLAGFKSFVEPVDFLIEPGLTGVVGPNGCGKSNLLEALRWVMGAASAKAMRGEGMDDVIFAGSGARPARNHAEVTLTIDNADGDAPAAFSAEPVLEVSRRIDRGEGSTYRVNGREVRARDVHILFADAATGANSPALVRQGQISELIAAKPQNRRRILEEAAGVSGLHGRRHEAELRLAAAAANLERLDDLARELEQGLARLRREARQAARYKAVSADIRALHASMAQRRWVEARAVEARASDDAAAANLDLEAATRVSAAAVARALEAEAAIAPLRAADTAAAAALAGLAIEKDRLDRDLEQAAGEARRLAADLTRLAGDDAREVERLEDIARSLARLDAEADALAALLAAAPDRAPVLAAEAQAAEAARAEADRAVEQAAAALAAAEAGARAALARLRDAETVLARVGAALAKTLDELDSLGPPADSGGAAEVAVNEAAAALTLARTGLEAAETARTAAESREAVCRQVARASEDELASVSAEAAALERLARPGADARYGSALEAVAPNPGLEAALAAALGDDLEAALDARAPAFWGGAEATPPVWPTGARSLADLVAAPAQLAARLAFTALVEAADGDALQAGLPPGARLVSRQGDLWRWDGYTARAEAPRPAQARLEQKARLAALETRIAELTPTAQADRAAQTASAAEAQAADAALRAARAAATEAERALAAARDAADGQARASAQREAKIALLTDTRHRLEAEHVQAEQDVEMRRTESDRAAPKAELAASLEQARAHASGARETAAVARAALEAETRERGGRQGRLQILGAERDGWRQRALAAEARREGLEVERHTAEAALAAARAVPVAAEATRAQLLDGLSAAAARKSASAEALSTAETARIDADREARTAEALAADARERRAGVAARLEAARERLAELTATLPEAADAPAAGVGDDLEPGAAEARLASLERERDAMGPVNLRAEEEAADQAERLASLAAERTDLASALARLRQAINELNAEGRERLLAAFEVVQGHFRDLFVALFRGGQAELRLVESDDPLEAGLEVLACPPGKRLAVMSLMSGGEQALTAMALIFAVFLSAPAPVCVLDEADAPLDDANVERFCDLLAAMRARAATRFIVITHNPLTMSRVDRLYGVTMREPGVSQLVSVDLRQAEAIAAQ